MDISNRIFVMWSLSYLCLRISLFTLKTNWLNIMSYHILLCFAPRYKVLRHLKFVYACILDSPTSVKEESLLYADLIIRTCIVRFLLTPECAQM